MNDPVKPAPAAAIKQNQIMLVGRLDRLQKFDGKYDHIITLPAPDEFSKPSVVRLNSTEKLGDVGEVVKCLAQFNGWPNNYQVTDQNGERKTVYDTRGFFVAL